MKNLESKSEMNNLKAWAIKNNFNEEMFEKTSKNENETNLKDLDPDAKTN